MTGLSGFQPGGELDCSECMFSFTGPLGEPFCLLALEIDSFGETMTANVCPQAVAA